MKTLHTTIALVLTVLVTNFATAAVDDWPTFRGLKHDDKSAEKGLLKKWPDGGPKRLWVFENGGLGYAGFAVVGDQLFTMGMDETDEFALCLNAETGKEIWRKPLAPLSEPRGRATAGWGDGPRSSPSVDGDHVYFMSAAGHLVCMKKKDGEKVWGTTMKEYGGAPPSWGFSESPLIDGDNLICTPGGKQGAILALNKKTGKKLWQTSELKAVAHYSSIIPVDWNNERQYIQLLVDSVVGISAKDGKVLWKSAWPGQTAVIPSPIFKDGKVYVTSGYRVGSKLVNLGADNKAEETWSNNEMQNHHGGVILVGDMIYGYTDFQRGAFACQSLKTGEIAWRNNDVKKGAVTHADGMFFHLEEGSGRVAMLKANEKGMEVVSEFRMQPQSKKRNRRGKIWAHPVIADGKLYVRDQELIHCYDLKNK